MKQRELELPLLEARTIMIPFGEPLAVVVTRPERDDSDAGREKAFIILSQIKDHDQAQSYITSHRSAYPPNYMFAIMAAREAHQYTKLANAKPPEEK